jgi:hypothetical protein
LALRLGLVLGLAAVAPAAASRPIEPVPGIEGVVEDRHGGALHPSPALRTGIPSPN